MKALNIILVVAICLTGADCIYQHNRRAQEAQQTAEFLSRAKARIQETDQALVENDKAFQDLKTTLEAKFKEFNEAFRTQNNVIQNLKIENDVMRKQLALKK